jgi:hypothetical protein
MTARPTELKCDDTQQLQKHAMPMLTRNEPDQVNLSHANALRLPGHGAESVWAHQNLDEPRRARWSLCSAFDSVNPHLPHHQ